MTESIQDIGCTTEKSPMSMKVIIQLAHVNPHLNLLLLFEEAGVPLGRELRLPFAILIIKIHKVQAKPWLIPGYKLKYIHERPNKVSFHVCSIPTTPETLLKSELDRKSENFPYCTWSCVAFIWSKHDHYIPDSIEYATDVTTQEIDLGSVVEFTFFSCNSITCYTKFCLFKLQIEVDALCPLNQIDYLILAGLTIFFNKDRRVSVGILEILQQVLQSYRIDKCWYGRIKLVKIQQKLANQSIDETYRRQLFTWPPGVSFLDPAL